MSFATVAFAAASSPATKTASRSFDDARPPVSRIFHPIVLKALTTREPGSRFATSSLDVLSPRSMTRPAAEYGFFASMTIFPANRSAGGSWSIFLQGIATRITSPNVAASAGVVAFALGPMDETRGSKDAGSREFDTATSCPAWANSFAAVPPICPAPMIPIRMGPALPGDRQHIRPLWSFGIERRSSDLPHSTSSPDVAARAGPRCVGGTRPNPIHDSILAWLSPPHYREFPVFMKWLWAVSLVSEERQSAVPATLT